MTATDHSVSDTLRPGLDARPRRRRSAAEPPPASSPTRHGRPSSPPSPTPTSAAAGTPHQVLDTAHDLLRGGQPDDEPLRASELATALVWRIGVLTEHGDHAGASTANPSTSGTTGTPMSGSADVDRARPARRFRGSEPHRRRRLARQPDRTARRRRTPATRPPRTRPRRASPRGSAGSATTTNTQPRYAYPSNAAIPRTRLLELNEQAADFYTARYPHSWAATTWPTGSAPTWPATTSSASATPPTDGTPSPTTYAAAAPPTVNFSPPASPSAPNPDG